MRRLSSGSVTSAQSASFAVAFATRLELEDDVAPGLLVLELTELILGLRGDMSDSLVSLCCFCCCFFFSFESLDCLTSFTMWPGRAEGFLIFCLRLWRRSIRPSLMAELLIERGRGLTGLMLPSEVLGNSGDGKMYSGEALRICMAGSDGSVRV